MYFSVKNSEPMRIVTAQRLSADVWRVEDGGETRELSDYEFRATYHPASDEGLELWTKWSPVPQAQQGGGGEPPPPEGGGEGQP